MKTYSQYMNAITPNTLYEGLLYGMFADRLPPIFSMDEFLSAYCVHCRNRPCPSPQQSRYISFDSIRNTGIPRRMGIPEPFSYEILCRYLKQEWTNLKHHFEKCTKRQAYKISQIHIRRQRKSKLIFKMNYQNRHEDADVIPDLRLTARFLVETDVSTCFPSIYTHALEWAITSRERSKDNLRRGRKEWGGELDKYVRSMRDNETCGILIGPHASNLISEIILTKVDEILCRRGYQFIRKIDDYECYTDTHDKAERFLSDLKDALGAYNLTINFTKTSIKELPLSIDDTWKQQLKAALVILPKGRIGRNSIATFLDTLVNIMKGHKNGAVFSYAVKALAGGDLAEEARLYYVKFLLHLAYCYPYLYQYLDKYVFYACDVETELIQAFSEKMFVHGAEVRNFEECSYALFFAVKYAFSLQSFDVTTIIKTQDCILLAMAWKYASCLGLEKEKQTLHDYALTLKGPAFEENWVFVYEALSEKELGGKWKGIKKKVSFFKHIEDIYPSHTPTFEALPILWTCRMKLDGLKEKQAFEKLYRKFVKDNPQYANISLVNEYLQCIIGNLLANSRLKKNALIYRTESHYTRAHPFGEKGEPHDYQMLKSVLNWLKSKHYIGERIGTRQTGGSCFWPKDVLRNKFQGLNLEALFRFDEPPVVVLKDKEKKQILPTPKTKKAMKYIHQLGDINSMYDKHQFACKLHGSNGIDGFKPRLKAVFNDSNWGHGGRLYASATMAGFNYQCIPSDMRKGIIIDGRPTVEVDYSGMHPHLLYAQLGKTLNGNAYDFLPVKDKPLAKFALLVMLNAKSKQAAIGALTKKFNALRTATGLSPKKEALRQALLDNQKFDKIVDDAARKHSIIRSYFYRGTGIRLQNIESAIALDIVHNFSCQDIPVLPVHDSFIIPVQYRKQLQSKMKKTFELYANGFSCPVK